MNVLGSTHEPWLSFVYGFVGVLRIPVTIAGEYRMFCWICRSYRQNRHPLFAISLALGVLCHGGLPAAAEEFLGIEVEKLDRTYVVRRDVNVRAKPDTKSNRIDGLKKGKRVKVVGRHQGWLAVVRDGKPLGFVYRKYLVPLVDGELEKPVRSSASINGDGKCAYEITFNGRSSAGIEEFSMADYEVQAQCERGGVELSFILYMFMTEGAYHPAKPNIHQIGIDLLEINDDGKYDESFTTNLFYNPEKGITTFSDISLETYAGKPKKADVETASIPEALSAAVQMALESWNAKAWDDLTAVLSGGLAGD